MGGGAGVGALPSGVRRRVVYGGDGGGKCVGYLCGGDRRATDGGAVVIRPRNWEGVVLFRLSYVFLDIIKYYD